MGTDRSIQTDELNVQLYREKVDKMNEFTEGSGVIGWITAKLYDSEGNIKHEETVRNKITDAGDLYIATRGIAAVAPATPGDATKVTGMKLGTSSTAADKAGTGIASLAASSDYISGSNQIFDATYPQTSNLGSTLGVTMVYQVTWAAGTATNATINSVVIVNDAATNATTTTGNTISRAVFASTINKGASDVLKVTWSHKQLGT